MDLRKKILLVDDDSETINFLTDNLVKIGFDVVFARDGEEGIEMMEKIDPDVIISEIFLQGMNGIEMCRIIRNKKGFQTLPFIILSDSDDELHYLSAVISGVNHYEIKPVKCFYFLERALTALTKNVKVEELEPA